MQAPLSKGAIGCIGKCISGLSPEDLDQITDNVSKTLAHPRGREIFKKYLERRKLKVNLECLELYETCAKFIEKEKYLSHSRKGSSADGLAEDVASVMEMAEDLDGVPQIDLALLKQFDEALTKNSRSDMFAVLEETRDRTRDYLRDIHESFKVYASEPCPLTK